MGIKSFFGLNSQDSDKKEVRNKFNEAFFKLIGGMYTAYDDNGETYVEKGYNINPTVFSVISQQAKKTSAVPYYIKKVKDESSRKQLVRLKSATKYNMSTSQSVKQAILESKAYEDKGDKDFPLDRPNPLQTWEEIHEMYKTFMKLNGNFYMYMVTRSHPKNMGQPLEVYVLPSQYTQIVLKDNISLEPNSDPISHYMLTMGDQFVEFPSENIIHIKYPNPNYGNSGEHLYGQAPLRAALRNLQADDLALDMNIKTLKSGGAYGLIHGKGVTLQEGQAAAVKDKLLEMEASSENLAKIAAVSQEMGFTRIGLTTDEMKPFEYLKFNEKEICNVLGWKDKLLNNDEGSNFGEYLKTLRKQVITDDIMPDLNLLASALNDKFLPRFSGYENCEQVYDPSELPEMQSDMGELTTWLDRALKSGVITRNEYRIALRYMEHEDANMDVITVAEGTMSLEDALENPFNSIDG